MLSELAGLLIGGRPALRRSPCPIPPFASSRDKVFCIARLRRNARVSRINCGSIGHQRTALACASHVFGATPCAFEKTRQSGFAVTKPQPAQTDPAQAVKRTSSIADLSGQISCWSSPAYIAGISSAGMDAIRWHARPTSTPDYAGKRLLSTFSAPSPCRAAKDERYNLRRRKTGVGPEKGVANLRRGKRIVKLKL